MEQHTRRTRRRGQQGDGLAHHADHLRGIGTQFPAHHRTGNAQRQHRDLLVHLVINLCQRARQRIQRGSQGARGFIEMVIIVSERRYRDETIGAILRQLDK